MRQMNKKSSKLTIKGDVHSNEWHSSVMERARYDES